MLLLKDEVSYWSIFSIVLESGFFLFVIFNCVFKSIVGVNFNEFCK